jgi:hypothetical protein
MVELQPPRDKNFLPPVKVWVIYAKEEENIERKIEWMLITTVKTETFDEACERIKWYSIRWGIEVYIEH